MVTRAFPLFVLGLLALFGCASTPPAPPPVPYGAYAPPAVSVPPSPSGPIAQQGPFRPNANLFLCRRGISNSPTAAANLRVLNYAPMIVVNGVALASAPSNDVCLTSGFGPRYGRVHKGIDLYSNPPGLVYSAAPGIVREVGVASGFGNQVVIDHGRGVFTRYAHLSSFASGLRPGRRIGFGVAIGRIGASGNATGPHLHYEVLTGNYNTPRKSFGLQAHNPLTFPAWAGINTTG